MESAVVEQHFARLLELLARARERRHYEAAEIFDTAAAGARSARAAGVRPEALLAGLRQYLRDAPLADLGDWYRTILIERLVLRVIEAYFDIPRQS